MCGRFSLTASGEEGAEALGLDEAPALAPRYNIAPTQPVAVVRLEPPEAHRRLALVPWGLVPLGSLEGERGFINARAETAWEKPSFRDAFARRRCLIPATGFYEWQRTEGRGRALAEGQAATCRILTTEPNDLARAVHDRMPVIVRPEDYARWLDPAAGGVSALRALFAPSPAEAMAAYRVGTAVGARPVEGPRGDRAGWPATSGRT